MTYTVRRPSLDDAPALHALMTACDMASIGFPDATLTDVVEELHEPDLNLERDGWIAVNADGTALGCVLVFTSPESDIVEFDIYVAPSAGGLAEQMWDLAEARALDFGRETGRGHVRLDIGLQRTDEPQRSRAAARGYEVATVFHRMRIDHAGQPDSPALPEGMTLRVVADDEALRDAAVYLRNATFAAHFGHVPRDRGWWDTWFETSISTGWESTRVLSADGVPAALLVETTQYVEDENCGYVQALGVLEEFRGRGLGRLLLLDVFARDAVLARTGTILHVDVNNVTPALGLYQSVGMRQVLVIDGWRKSVTL